MPPAPRHSRPRTTRKPAVRVGVPVLAAATLAGVAAAFVFLSGGSPGAAAARPVHGKISVTSAASGPTSDDMMIDSHHEVAARTVRDNARAIRRKYLAHLASVRLAQKKAAQAAQAAQAGRRRRRRRSRPPPSRPRAPARQPAPAAAVQIQPTRPWGSASATPRKAAATRGARATAAAPTSSRSARGKSTAVRPASSAWPARLTRTRSSTMPSMPGARRTGPPTTAADGADAPAVRGSKNPGGPRSHVQPGGLAGDRCRAEQQSAWLGRPGLTV